MTTIVDEDLSGEVAGENMTIGASQQIVLTDKTA